MTLSPGGIILWLVVGLIAGWAAGQVSRGHGFGLLGDIIVGLIGALIGGFLASFFIAGNLGFIGTTIVAFLGAVILLFVLRAFSGRRIRA
jgi:uncharacterized membrane protein YeaQ/YmgE (transglycosylase-associated protein family)